MWIEVYRYILNKFKVLVFYEINVKKVIIWFLYVKYIFVKIYVI